MAKIKIEIVSDVVCPWCYIGKVRLEKALQAVNQGSEFEVSYLPFELNPGTAEAGLDRRTHLVDKFGGEERYNALQDHVSGIASAEGIEFQMELQKTIPNTLKAHILIDYAANHNLQQPLVEKLFRAYFSDGVDLTKDENLIALSVAVGLDREQIERIIADPEAAKRVKDREQEMYKLGISGVPFYIINGKYGISGAQPTEIFVKALNELQAQTVEAEACNVETKDC